MLCEGSSIGLFYRTHLHSHFQIARLFNRFTNKTNPPGQECILANVTRCPLIGLFHSARLWCSLIVWSDLENRRLNGDASLLDLQARVMATREK